MESGKIIVVANQKGGVAKTSTVRNLSYALAEMGKKVLVVDFDPQYNLTTSFGVLPTQAPYNTGTLITNLLLDESLPDTNEFIQKIGSVDLIPSSRSLTVAEANLLMTPDSNDYLAALLNPLRLSYDYITVSLSSAQYPFQLLAVSRPVDISPLLSELSATLTSSSDVKQKELLKQEIVEMGAFALSGEVVERQFYIKIWDRVSDGVERDLLQKLKLLGGYFSDSGIQTEILQQQDIVRLCNLVNNPAYVHLEDSGINAAIPILESVGVV